MKRILALSAVLTVFLVNHGGLQAKAEKKVVKLHTRGKSLESINLSKKDLSDSLLEICDQAPDVQAEQADQENELRNFNLVFNRNSGSDQDYSCNNQPECSPPGSGACQSAQIDSQSVKCFEACNITTSNVSAQTVKIKNCGQAPIINNNASGCGQQATACPQGKIMMCKDAVTGECAPKTKNCYPVSCKSVCKFDPKNDLLTIKFADCSRLAEGATVKMTFSAAVKPNIDLIPGLVDCLPQGAQTDPHFWVPVQFESTVYIHPGMLSSEQACEALGSACLPACPGIENQVFNAINAASQSSTKFCEVDDYSLCLRSPFGTKATRQIVGGNGNPLANCTNDCSANCPQPGSDEFQDVLRSIAGAVGRTKAFYPLSKGGCDPFARPFDPVCDGSRGFHPLSLNVAFNPVQCSNRNTVTLGLFPHHDACKSLAEGNCIGVNGKCFFNLNCDEDALCPQVCVKPGVETSQDSCISSLEILPGTLSFEVISSNLACEGDGAVSCKKICDACVPSPLECLCELKDSGVISTTQFNCLMEQLKDCGIEGGANDCPSDLTRTIETLMLLRTGMTRSVDLNN